MPIELTRLKKPLNNQIIDPSTGVLRQEWIDYFGNLTGQLNSAVGELGADSVEYLVGAASSELAAERVVTDTTSITWDLATAGQAKAKRAALSGDVSAAADSNTVTVNKVAGKPLSSSGDRWDVIPFVASDGVMEIGANIDFHGTDGDTSDNLLRLRASDGSCLFFTPTIGAQAGQLRRAASVDNASVATGDLMYWNSFDCARLAIGSNGQVLTVSAGAPAWSTSWTTVVKASDENRQSNTTLADDGALLVPLAANTNYIIRGEVFYNTPTTADFKFSFNGPASPSLVNIAHFGVDADGTAVGSPGSDEAYGVSTSATGAAGTFGWVKFSALIRNGANAGNFAFQWAQNSSVASNTTVRAGSHVEYRTV